jgi:hypothetical protein
MIAPIEIDILCDIFHELYTVSDKSQAPAWDKTVSCPTARPDAILSHCKTRWHLVHDDSGAELLSDAICAKMEKEQENDK